MPRARTLWRTRTRTQVKGLKSAVPSHEIDAKFMKLDHLSGVCLQTEPKLTTSLRTHFLRRHSLIGELTRRIGYPAIQLFNSASAPSREHVLLLELTPRVGYSTIQRRLSAYDNST